MPSPDWSVIERDYRAGILSVREIASAQGISHTAVQKRAKTYEWERDLKAKIKAKADALVAKREVASLVAIGTVATEQQIIEGNAEAVARVRMGHRSDISRARNLAVTLLAELEFQTGNQDLFDELQDLIQPEADADDTAAARDRAFKLREAFNKAMSLGGRTKTMKDLADTLKTLVALEREAYSVDSTPDDKPPDEIDVNDVARRLAFMFAGASRTIQ